jgi:hypothetical protein
LTPLRIPDNVGLTGLKFADRLEQAGPVPFFQVLWEFQAAQRPILLAICAAAVLQLLQEKNLLDLKHVVEAFQQER